VRAAALPNLWEAGGKHGLLRSLVWDPVAVQVSHIYITAWHCYTTPICGKL